MKSIDSTVFDNLMVMSIHALWISLALKVCTNLIDISIRIEFLLDSISIPLVFKTNLPDVSRLNKNANEDVKLDCTFDGLPRPKVVWLRGKLPLKYSESTYQLKDHNGR